MSMGPDAVQQWVLRRTGFRNRCRRGWVRCRHRDFGFHYFPSGHKRRRRLASNVRPRQPLWGNDVELDYG